MTKASPTAVVTRATGIGFPPNAPTAARRAVADTADQNQIPTQLITRPARLTRHRIAQKCKSPIARWGDPRTAAKPGQGLDEGGTCDTACDRPPEPRPSRRRSGAALRGRPL